VHTLTDAVGRDVRALWGTDRVVTVHPAATPLPATATPSPVVRDIVDGEPYVLALGAAEARKNLVTLARAYANAGAGTRLVLAGAPGPDSPQLDMVLRDTRRVVRVGYVSADDRAALLRNARALVHPAIDEGFGIPVVEAMDAGVPVVCTDTPVLREVAGDAALFVPSWDITTVAAVDALVADDGTRQRLITAGTRQAALYSWERTAHGMAELYWRAVHES
jgi:glycosyltransferase involved in cell wall biosynthesis